MCFNGVVVYFAFHSGGSFVMVAKSVSSAIVSTVTQGMTLIFALAASGKRRQQGQFSVSSTRGEGGGRGPANKACLGVPCPV